VVIEARLFQVTEKAARELGFKRVDGTMGTFNFGNSAISAGVGKTHAGAAPALPGALPAGNFTNAAYGGVVGAVLDMSTFNATLMALNQTDGVKALSNPKITVSSDQQATINIGQERPIVKQTVQQGTGAGGTSIVTFELDGDFGGETVQEEQLLPSGVKVQTQTKNYTTRKGYLSIGTKLAVMPSVKTEDQIYVKVVPELVSEDGNPTTFGKGDYAVQYPNLKNTRVKTEFTIRNGQTIAIGGLVDDQMISTKQSVPVLGSIPLIGSLFRYSKDQKTKVETLIFLTVTLVPTEKMHTTVGLPIRSTAIVDEVDTIKKEDLAGAAYDQERARKEAKRIADEQAKLDRPWWKKDAKKSVPAEEVPAAPPAAGGGDK
jgi:type II secretory pathway component GspD/PulD (secretin)